MLLKRVAGIGWSLLAVSSGMAGLEAASIIDCFGFKLLDVLPYFAQGRSMQQMATRLAFVLFSWTFHPCKRCRYLSEVMNGMIFALKLTR